jgi:hypothetical protein
MKLVCSKVSPLYDYLSSVRSNCEKQVAEKYQQMSNYDNDWVTLDFVRNYLKNARR